MLVSRTQTLHDVAKIAQVSPSTVSRILNGTAVVSPEKRKQVEHAIATLDYRPNMMAQALAKGRSMTVGVVTQAISSPFYAETLEGVEQGFADSLYHPMFISGHWRQEKELEAINILTARRVDALIILGGNLEDAYLKQLAKQIPVVPVGRLVVGLEAQSVRINQFNGAISGMQHLIDLGHRRIAHIAGPTTHRDSTGRLEGYQQMLAANGIAFDPSLVVTGNYQEHSGLLAMEQLLLRDTSITAVFSANDQMALGARLCLYRRGIRVPDDISIVGFDDLFSSSYATPPLTTVRQPGQEMGVAAALMVLSLLNGRPLPDPIFTPHLVVRESTTRLRHSQ